MEDAPYVLMTRQEYDALRALYPDHEGEWFKTDSDGKVSVHGVLFVIVDPPAPHPLLGET